MKNKTIRSKPFYDVHVFFCLNERKENHPRGSCAARGSIELHSIMKKRAKELGIQNIRINKAGCLDRCELGPVAVIYPEGVWYNIQTKEDIENVLNRHILKGQIVDELKLMADQKDLTVKRQNELEVQVVAIKKLTNEIKSFELQPTQGQFLPPFTPGSHIDIIMSNGKTRSYSLANNPKERERYLIAILREHKGKGGSRWMHKNINNGDQLKITAPKNDFKLTDQASSYIFIAGGIGISPILSMGHHLHNMNASCFLHYCTRNPYKTAFLEEVKTIFKGNVSLYHDDRDPLKGINLKQVLQNRKEGQHLYICGPCGLIDAALAAATDWPEGTVHFELFSPKKPDLLSKNQNFKVVIASTNETLEVTPGKSILEVIKKAAIKVSSSCEGGVCGTCRTGLLHGEADHRDNVLTQAEKNAQTEIMVCVSRAKKGEKLILDL
jgi:ferredoxin-NADP reductase/(2Fe-2S) ferredoxin